MKEVSSAVPSGPVRCECGDANDEPCCWAAYADLMVRVEILWDAGARADVARDGPEHPPSDVPVSLRPWPEKYTRRLRVTRACADLLIARDGWARRCP